MMYFHYIETHIVQLYKILVIGTHKGICDIIFPFQEHYHNLILLHNLIQCRLDIFADLEKELHAYSTGNLKIFTVQLDMQGTEYQKKIWRILQTIPYGKTLSYKQLAEIAGSAPRAVGGANKRNRLPIVIPCHRVIQHNSGLGGYFGYTNDIKGLPIVNVKKILLEHEALYSRIATKF